jgi:hypothetical protein
VKCPKCGCDSVKMGFKRKKAGRVQRYQCERGHIFEEMKK